ncbi:MAG: Fe-S cluster assembly protein IscX [Alphaproteobacteria bacterium]|nr:Fe-S cluster assembly protein IscX [Alphaproteobacteria bacterium]
MGQKLKWTDTYDIAIALEEAHPNIDILSIRFTDLWQWIQNLEGFADEPNKSNEKILEAIQMAWLDERS